MARRKLSANEKVVFAPSISNQAAPTQAELTAGLALATPGTYVHAGLRTMSGFESKTTFIPVPDAATNFDSQIPGRTQSGSPSLEFYDDDASTTIRSGLAEGTAGYIVRMPYGQVTGKRCMVFPATIGALNDSQLTNGNDPHTVMVDVAITAQPTKTAIITA